MKKKQSWRFQTKHSFLKNNSKMGSMNYLTTYSQFFCSFPTTLYALMSFHSFPYFKHVNQTFFFVIFSTTNYTCLSFCVLLIFSSNEYIMKRASCQIISSKKDEGLSKTIKWIKGVDVSWNEDITYESDERERERERRE